MHWRGLHARTPAHFCAQSGPGQRWAPPRDKGQAGSRPSVPMYRAQVRQPWEGGRPILCHLQFLTAQMLPKSTALESKQQQNAGESHTMHAHNPGEMALLSSKDKTRYLSCRTWQRALRARKGNPFLLQCLSSTFYGHHQSNWQKKTISPDNMARTGIVVIW